MKIFFLFLTIYSSFIIADTESYPCPKNKLPSISKQAVELSQPYNTLGDRVHTSCPEWAYIPKKLLTSKLSLKCKLTQKRNVYIYGENHTSNNDEAVSWYVNGVINNKGKAIKFNEGQAGIDHERGFYGLNSIGIARAYSDLMLYLAQSKNPLFSKVIHRHLSDSLCFFKELHLKDSLSKTAAQINKSLRFDQSRCHHLLEKGLKKLDQENLYAHMEKFKSTVKNHILESNFKGVSSEKIDTRVIQELREMEWVEIINDALCSQENNVKDFWVQVGSYHSKSLNCVLNEVFSNSLTLGANSINLQSITQEDINFIERRNNLQNSIVNIFNLSTKKLGLSGEVSIANRDTFQGFLMNLSQVPKEKRKQLINIVQDKIRDDRLQIEDSDGSALQHVKWSFRDLTFLTNK